MSSPFPGLNWTVSTGQTGLDTLAETAGKEKAAPPTRSATAAALLGETMPFMSFSLEKISCWQDSWMSLARAAQRTFEELRARKFILCRCEFGAQKKIEPR